MQLFVAIFVVIFHSVFCFVWLQIDINDNHQTLTNKSVASITWAIGYCGQHFTFLLKTDDDSFNVPQRFVQYLSSLADSDTDNFAFVGGLCSSGEVRYRVYCFIVLYQHVIDASFSSPNLSRRRLYVYHTSTHGVALVQI